MDLFANINKHRREIMRSLTRNIGNTDAIPQLSPDEKVEIKRILISRPNSRLGNMLLITPLLQEVSATFPHAKIDVFVRGGVAPILFKNYSNVERIIQLPGKPFKHLLDYAYSWLRLKKHRYDLVINVVKNSSSGRLSTKFTSSRFKMFGDINNEIVSKYPDHRHVAKYPVYNFRRFMTLIGFSENEKAVPALNLKLNLPELAEGHRQLKNLVNNNKRTIGIFTYATGAKCYSPEWWEPFYTRLKQEFPDYNIVEILPKENISQIAFKAPVFYSNDVREIGAFIANTDIFIGADSGIMHLASAVQTPVVGLFHVTEKETFGPYCNDSVAVNTNETGTDELIEIIRNILKAKTTKPAEIVKRRLTA
jgi:ADP-heptose:LPS heptosyltransferase